MSTKIIQLKRSAILDRDTLDQQGHFRLDRWSFKLADQSHNETSIALLSAASVLKQGTSPVAFPTETVYGLGADARNGVAVRKIFSAKQRPADNPLIVHVASLSQLRKLLLPHKDISFDFSTDENDEDPIPSIYWPLISRFWPGPLSIILPNPPNSRLAPEVTAGLPTFAARIPNNLFALALCTLSEAPLAAPSANASGRPSPTTAQHVYDDLAGRIDVILDGGPCQVGVESTVVNGLVDPPCILRPGGISLESLRQCSGWEKTTVAYDVHLEAASAPQAPGMKYRHYSPKAKVILVEHRQPVPSLSDIQAALGKSQSAGVIRTFTWSKIGAKSNVRVQTANGNSDVPIIKPAVEGGSSFFAEDPVPISSIIPSYETSGDGLELWDMQIGCTPEDVARNLFSALRILDSKQVNVIYVEGIDDQGGELSAAVMNRLRKAAGDQAIAPNDLNSSP